MEEITFSDLLTELNLTELDFEILKTLAEFSPRTADRLADEIAARGWPVMPDGTLALSRSNELFAMG